MIICYAFRIGRLLRGVVNESVWLFGSDVRRSLLAEDDGLVVKAAPKSIAKGHELVKCALVFDADLAWFGRTRASVKLGIGSLTPFEVQRVNDTYFIAVIRYAP